MAPKALRGDRLRQMRESYGLSQAELAQRVEAHVNQIHRYENGVADPSPYQLKRIAHELRVTSDYLLGLVEYPNAHLSEPALTADERKFLAALRQGELRTLLRLIDQALPDEQEQPDVPGVDVAANGEPLNGVERPVPR